MLATLLRPFFKRRHRKNFLLLLWHEMNANMERYYVIDQRQFITAPFEMGAWDEAERFSGQKFPLEVLDYAVALEEFNAALADVQLFEGKYLSSLEHKTLENAQILHDKKEALELKVKTIQQKIVSAQNALRAMMEKRSHA